MKPKQKAKNKAYARYRWREKHKKQYTFTKTKFVVGFLISLFTSIFLGSYFDKYGSIVLRQSAEAIRSAWAEDSGAGENPSDLAQGASSPTQPQSPSLDEALSSEDIEALEQRAKAVLISPKKRLKKVEIRSASPRPITEGVSENTFPPERPSVQSALEDYTEEEFEAFSFSAPPETP